MTSIDSSVSLRSGSPDQSSLEVTCSKCSQKHTQVVKLACGHAFDELCLWWDRSSISLTCPIDQRSFTKTSGQVDTRIDLSRMNPLFKRVKADEGSGEKEDEIYELQVDKLSKTHRHLIHTEEYFDTNIKPVINLINGICNQQVFTTVPLPYMKGYRIFHTMVAEGALGKVVQASKILNSMPGSKGVHVTHTAEVLGMMSPDTATDGSKIPSLRLKIPLSERIIHILSNEQIAKGKVAKGPLEEKKAT